MWWGGFSETKAKAMKDQKEVLIPMWWGGFSEGKRFRNIPAMRES